MLHDEAFSISHDFFSTALPVLHTLSHSRIKAPEHPFST